MKKENKIRNFFINYDLFSRASFINRLIQNSVKKKAGKNNKSIIK